MTSCLLLDPAPGTITEDLEAAGIHVFGAVPRNKVVREIGRVDADVLIGHVPVLDDALFELLTVVRDVGDCAVLLFTGDIDAQRIARAVDAGVHALVIDAYDPARLRPLIHLARARFSRERDMRDALADMSKKFDERKLVDRAKGIVMRATQVSEDEAFRLLRTASMNSHQRLGQVSQQLIAAAGIAEAINLAGQLRMLSQRLVKLCVLEALGGGAVPDSLRSESAARIDANLSVLEQRLAAATYGDLIAAIRQPWSELKTHTARAVDRQRLALIDASAEDVLVQADRLVGVLESGSAFNRLHLLNVSGRQRMLSQRVAKLGMLAKLLPRQEAARSERDAVQARSEFEQAMSFLEAAPLGSPAIRELLAEASQHWEVLNWSIDRIESPDAQSRLAHSSEALLSTFEDLTQRYERSMQVLMG